LEFGVKSLLEQIKDANNGYGRWEQVSTVYLTMEPFAMANGQLTQSYKVKRDAVTARYYDELPK
jgi:long-chain acyl-CoA synthetase